MATDINRNMYQFVSEDAEILSLEKASKRPLEVTDITKALDEYKRLYKAGIQSPAELITLVRAFPNNKVYTTAAQKMGMFDDDFEPMVVGGPASVELVDREGHLITNNALAKAFDSYMENFRTRNAMVLHSDVQVGWALPAYISKAGNIYKSGVDPAGLFFITELRDDTRIAKRVMEQIKEGKLKSYSIAGSATKTQNIQKGMESYMQVDDMELAEVTVCEKGVNQGAAFDILKGDRGKPTASCIDGSCLTKSEHAHNPTTILIKEDGKIDFLSSLLNLVKDEDPFTNTQGAKDLSMFSDKAYRLREQTHHRLLDEQGFPAELEPEWNRYIPVSETEVDDEGKIIHQRPPWVVNEAGEDLGTRWTNEALSPPKGKPHDKPYNVQKSAVDIFLEKEKEKDVTKVAPLLAVLGGVGGLAGRALAGGLAGLVNPTGGGGGNGAQAEDDEVELTEPQRFKSLSKDQTTSSTPAMCRTRGHLMPTNKIKTSGERPLNKFLPLLIAEMLSSNRNKKTLKKGILGRLGKVAAAEAGKKVGEAAADKLTKKDKS